MSVLVPLADVAYVEPWWMQILKSLVIFLVGLQILPVMIEIAGDSANSQPIAVRGRNCSLVSSLTMSAIGVIAPNGPTRLGP